MDGKQHKPTQQGSEVQIALVDLIHLSQQEGNYNPEDDREEDRLCREVQTVCGQALAHIDRLTSMVYETAPGEYSPDGWTYKQAFEAELKRRKEAEHAIEEAAELRAELAEARRHAKVLWSASLVSIAKAPPCYKPTPALADAIAYVEKLL